jgi:DNA-directed RNA polymerase III subunit RPC1
MYGFSIGIEDVTPTFETKDQIAKGYAEVAGKIDLFNSGRLERLPGCDSDQTLETLVNGILGRIRNSVGGVVLLATHAASARSVCMWVVVTVD